MTTITRRAALGALASIPAVAGAGNALASQSPAIEVPDGDQMTARERYDFHLKELRKAAEEIDPRIGHWRCTPLSDDEDGGCAVVISAHRCSGRYEGDGIYEGGRDRIRYSVRLNDYKIDGDRTFSVNTSMDRMVLTEPAFETFMGKRLRPL